MNKKEMRAISCFMGARNYYEKDIDIYREGNVMYYSLYSTIIAKFDLDSLNIYVTLGDYNTDLVKSRLRSIPSVYLISKGGKLYLNDREWNGSWRCIRPSLNITYLYIKDNFTDDL